MLQPQGRGATPLPQHPREKMERTFFLGLGFAWLVRFPTASVLCRLGMGGWARRRRDAATPRERARGLRRRTSPFTGASGPGIGDPVAGLPLGYPAAR